MATAIVCELSHVEHVFDVLHHALVEGAPAPTVAFDTNVICPFFVTLKKKDGADYDLRGCIGTLSPRSIALLSMYARKSAFEDRRFEPLLAHELPSLQVGVSLLVAYEPAAHAEDWTIGVHGIIIEFTVGGREYSATYLPDVAPEQGWDQRAAVASLVKKAGWSKALPPGVYDAMKVTRYQSSKATLTYAEWKGRKR